MSPPSGGGQRLSLACGGRFVLDLEKGGEGRSDGVAYSVRRDGRAFFEGLFRWGLRASRGPVASWEGIP
ncbi:hypothetical protein WCP94_001514 [Bilophila wadsworthia]